MPRIQHKRGTSANLASVNPTPLAGELVWDSTENAIKIGDGSTAWTSLAYVTATPRTHTHSADAITSGTIDYARLPVGSTTSTVCAGDDSRLTDARTPTAHKSTHATGGSDALTPSDIGAAPAVNPAFTGAATFANTGNVVPLTVTNTGSGNSFVVNDAAGDTTPFVVNADGRVGVQTASPTVDFEIGTSSSVATRHLAVRRGTAPAYISNALEGGSLATATFAINVRETSSGGALSWSDFGNTGFGASAVRLGSTTLNSHVSFWTASAVNTTPSERARIDGNGRLGIGTTVPATALDVNGVITVSATSGSAGSYAPSLTISGDANTGFGQVSGQSDTASVFTAGHERVRVDSSGRVGIGTTPSYAIDVAYNDSYQMRLKRAVSGQAGLRLEDSAGNFHQIASASNIFVISSGASERLRIDASGRLGVGTTGPSALLDINSDTIRLRTARTPASATAAGNAGDICWDASYLYICTATNTWRRIAHDTW